MPVNTKFIKLDDHKNEITMPAKREITAAVKKAIRDNLKIWSAQELDGNRDCEGFTARGRLTDAKTMHLADPKKFPIGKFF